MYVAATAIFIELIVKLWYRFLYSPNYLNKLIKDIKEIIWMLAPYFLVFFWYV
jgi:hypothetical protein